MAETKLDTAKIVNAALPSLPFWESKIFIGSVIALLALVAQQFGWVASITPAGQDRIADIIVALLQGGGGLLAAISRLTQKAAPPIGVTP